MHVQFSRVVSTLFVLPILASSAAVNADYGPEKNITTSHETKPTTTSSLSSTYSPITVTPVINHPKGTVLGPTSQPSSKSGTYEQPTTQSPVGTVPGPSESSSMPVPSPKTNIPAGPVLGPTGKYGPSSRYGPAGDVPTMMTFMSSVQGVTYGYPGGVGKVSPTTSVQVGTTAAPTVNAPAPSVEGLQGPKPTHHTSQPGGYIPVQKTTPSIPGPTGPGLGEPAGNPSTPGQPKPKVNQPAAPKSNGNSKGNGASESNGNSNGNAASESSGDSESGGAPKSNGASGSSGASGSNGPSGSSGNSESNGGSTGNGDSESNGGKLAPAPIVTVGGSAVMASSSGGAVMIGSATISPNGPVATVNGQVVTAQANGGFAVEGTHTYSLDDAGHAIIVAAGSTMTAAEASGALVIGTKTLVPGGPAATINGEMMSVAPGGSIVVSSSQHIAVPATTASTQHSPINDFYDYCNRFKPSLARLRTKGSLISIEVATLFSMVDELDLLQFFSFASIGSFCYGRNEMDMGTLETER
ncbi:MAG: hypothetical protein M1828_006135 [Chrysothrix sp. TS-e1954]|nr:MAG: hypothetical protein M1828_006135 [Chrysothrix sp. TS-e1954]